MIPTVDFSRKSQKFVLLSLSWGGQSVLAEFEKSAQMPGNNQIRDYCTIKYQLLITMFINFFLFRMFLFLENWDENRRRNRRKSSRNFNRSWQWVIFRWREENIIWLNLSHLFSVSSFALLQTLYLTCALAWIIESINFFISEQMLTFWQILIA